MSAILAIMGFILVIVGSQAGWIFTGAVSVLTGEYLIRLLRPNIPELQIILYALTSGMIGIGLHYYLKKWMVYLAALIAGAYTCYFLPGLLGWDTAWLTWKIALLAGAVTAVSVALWGSLPRILFSTLMGATIIIQNVHLEAFSPIAMWIILSIFGLLAQWLFSQYALAETDD